MNKYSFPQIKHWASACLFLATLGANIQLSALPAGGNVTHGSASIDTSIPGEVLIDVASERAVLEWSSYNLAEGEIVDYLMSDTGSVLNIINQGDASQINGLIFGDGRVYLVNTHGFTFGQSSQVIAGSLIASTLSIDADNFMAGEPLSAVASSDRGIIINNGNLSINEGGNVALLANSVVNNGNIDALAGKVVLAAGEAMTIDYDANGLIQLALTEAVAENIEGLESAITNSEGGQISGAQVTLAAKVASDIFTHAVNHQGIIEAQNFVTGEAGTVLLLGDGADIPITENSRFAPGGVEVNVVLINAPSEPEPQPEPQPQPEPLPEPQPEPEPPVTPPPSDNGDQSGGQSGSLESVLANSDEAANTEELASTSNVSLGLYDVQSPAIKLPADQLEEE